MNWWNSHSGRIHSELKCGFERNFPVPFQRNEMRNDKKVILLTLTIDRYNVVSDGNSQEGCLVER